MATEAKRALGIAWGIAFLSLIYAELNAPPVDNAFTSLLAITTEDSPAACFGFLTGATMMHFLHLSRTEEERERARNMLILVSGFCLVSGLVLGAIQSAIVPITVTVGIVALVLLPILYLNSLVLGISLVVISVLAALIHSVFIMNPPVGGPYPLLAWIAYGICGVLIYRAMWGRRTVVYVLFWAGIIVSSLQVLTLAPNYFPTLFSVNPEVGSYYRDNPQNTSLLFLSSAAHSGGLLNILGNFAAGTYLLSACFVLQRFRIMGVFYPVGRLAFSTYPFYVLASAITMGGFSGVSEEISAALETTTVNNQQKAIDWPTFSSWVNDSQSWQELSAHEKQFNGTNNTSLINEKKVKGFEYSAFDWSYPFAALGTLIFSNLWLRRYGDGLIEMALLRRKRRG